jgi:hypothetical protein
LCAVFTPEIKFGDAWKMKAVEGISTIPSARWSSTCKICGIANQGCTVRCADCPKEFHISCAWKANYKFGFEIQPVRNMIICLNAILIDTYLGEEYPARPSPDSELPERSRFNAFSHLL